MGSVKGSMHLEEPPASYRWLIRNLRHFYKIIGRIQISLFSLAVEDISSSRLPPAQENGKWIPVAEN